MAEQRTYSLSYLLEEMIRRQTQHAGGMKGASRGGVTVTEGVSILKTLWSAGEKGMALTELAMKSGIRLGPCQEMVEQLQNEKLVMIEPDTSQGNDRVRLTEKGVHML